MTKSPVSCSRARPAAAVHKRSGIGKRPVCALRFRGIAQKAVEALKSVLPGIPAASRIAVEKDRLSALFGDVISGHSPRAEQVDLGPGFYRMRKRKDPDELQLIAGCVKAIEAGYAVARPAIHPGATGLDVFKEMHGEIVRHAGYNLKFEADFACGMRAINGGGTPLRREILAGDLYIIDIHPSFHGYYGDLCRTFAASSPTDLQVKAWEIARDALRIAEETIRPCVRALDVCKQLRHWSLEWRSRSSPAWPPNTGPFTLRKMYW